MSYDMHYDGSISQRLIQFLCVMISLLMQCSASYIDIWHQIFSKSQKVAKMKIQIMEAVMSQMKCDGK